MELQLRQSTTLTWWQSNAAKKTSRMMGNGDQCPMPETVIYADDVLMIAGSDFDLARLPQE